MIYYLCVNAFVLDYDECWVWALIISLILTRLVLPLHFMKWKESDEGQANQLYIKSKWGIYDFYLVTNTELIFFFNYKVMVKKKKITTRRLRTARLSELELLQKSQ